jgi:hypothetical protein
MLQLCGGSLCLAFHFLDIGVDVKTHCFGALVRAVKVRPSLSP